jgi:hypothetical protein
MKSWTPDASQHFESWLGRVRTSVAGDPTIDPDDVAQDLRAHVHAELAAAPEPVTIGELDRVLTSLGPPTQWTDAVNEGRKERWHLRMERDVMSIIRSMQQRIAAGWGMPLLLGLLTAVGLLSFYDGGIVLVGLAYFFARSIVTYAPVSLVGRQRWFVYAPLALGAGSLTALVLGFPLALEIGPSHRHGITSLTSQAIWVVGLWWIVVGFIAGREIKRVQIALKPFADGFDRTHARMLMLIGVAFMLAATIDLLPRFF